MLLDGNERQSGQHPAPCTLHLSMSVRAWWDQANESDQVAVLRYLNLLVGLAGVPWAFLPLDAQAIMTRRLRIDAARLGKDER